MSLAAIKSLSKSRMAVQELKQPEVAVQAEERSEQAIRMVQPEMVLLKRKREETSENQMSSMVIPKNSGGTEKTCGKRRMKRNEISRKRVVRTRRRRRRTMDLLDTRERGGYLVLRNMGSTSGRRTRWRLYSRKSGERLVCPISFLGVGPVLTNSHVLD